MSGSVDKNVHTCEVHWDGDSEPHTMELLDQAQHEFIESMTVLCGYVKFADGEYLGSAHFENGQWNFVRLRHVVSNDNVPNSPKTTP
jgi:hypothetical protein